ncbi:cation:proton antiporter regulatory subunit [Halobaculum litoreum]|uniref:cation:proton antiporter regulatory subunit n=1 Tax=Halobaculum litoreum TaxID=3031998 RepID=UPI0024C3FC2E|nr:TrkA C-terminal domain-containing protein [Halobaculum sp. DT92]
MRVFETELPGVGRRYTAKFPDGGQFVIVHRNDGRRRTYWRGGRPTATASRCSNSPSRRRARSANCSRGATSPPVAADLDDAFEEAPIRSVGIDAGSPVADATIRETGIRSRTGASILAIRRGDDLLSNPDPDTAIRAGDTLVVVGTEEAYDALDRLLAG